MYKPVGYNDEGVPNYGRGSKSVWQAADGHLGSYDEVVAHEADQSTGYPTTRATSADDLRASIRKKMSLNLDDDSEKRHRRASSVDKNCSSESQHWNFDLGTTAAPFGRHTPQHAQRSRGHAFSNYMAAAGGSISVDGGLPVLPLGIVTESTAPPEGMPAVAHPTASAGSAERFPKQHVETDTTRQVAFDRALVSWHNSDAPRVGLTFLALNFPESSQLHCTGPAPELWGGGNFHEPAAIQQPIP